jgi:hypothetical protein
MPLLYLAVLLIVVFFIAKWTIGLVKSVLTTILVLLLGLLVLYALGLGPFEQKVVSLQSLKSNHCDATEISELWKCQCVIVPIEKELKKRFSREELDSLELDRMKSLYLLRKAFINQEAEIQSCLNEKGLSESAEKVFYSMIVKDLSRFNFQLKDIVNWKPDLPSFNEEIDKRFE